MGNEEKKGGHGRGCDGFLGAATRAVCVGY